MDAMAEEQLDYDDEEFGGSQKMQYHGGGGGSISALAEDITIGEDDEGCCRYWRWKTHVVPVADGYVAGSSIKSVLIAGKDVTLFIQPLMKERGEHIPPEDLLEVARKVKENSCYTCSNIVKEYN